MKLSLSLRNPHRIRLFLVSLALAFSSLSTLSAEPQHIVKIRFLTRPEKAEVYLDVSGKKKYEKFLGLTGQTILLDLSKLEGSSGFFVILRKDGYFDKRERISSGYFTTRDVYPEAGRIRLEPVHWTVPVRFFFTTHWLALTAGAGCLGFLGLLAALKQRRLLTRVNKLNALRATASSPDPRLNSVLSDWRLVECLGRGGSSTVYKAVPDLDLDEDKAVAIKLFSEDVTKMPDFKKRFEREAQVYGKLKHPGIPLLLDWGESDSLYYLVMELVRGTSLAELSGEGPMNPTLVVDYLVKAVEILDYAHGQEIIHRDVKPQNLLLTEDGDIKLLDFGLARHVLSSFTQTGHALGTPAYMAPEQIQGKFVDHRCDQYSLGALAYELLSGEKPFVRSDSSTSSVLFQQVHADPEQLREKKLDLPQALETLITQLMQRDPSRRFPNMKALKGELQAISHQLAHPHKTEDEE